MENAGIGTWIAQGAIVLFLIFLLALFIRTMLMVGSVVALSFTRSKRARRASQADDEPLA